MSKPKFEPVAAWWDEFAKAVMPKNASTVQRWEMRRAFYAGVFMSLLMCREDIGHPELPEGEGEEWLEKWWSEVLAFYEAIKEGRA